MGTVFDFVLSSGARQNGAAAWLPATLASSHIGFEPLLCISKSHAWKMTHATPTRIERFGNTNITTSMTIFNSVMVSEWRYISGVAFQP